MGSNSWVATQHPTISRTGLEYEKGFLFKRNPSTVYIGRTNRSVDEPVLTQIGQGAVVHVPRTTPVHFGDLECAVAIHGFDYGNMAIGTVGTILTRQEGERRTDLRVVVHAQAVRGGVAPPVAAIAEIVRRSYAQYVHWPAA